MRALLVLLLLLLPSTAFAQDRIIKDIPAGEDKISPIRKGEPAPFDGQLFETNTALRWGNWIKQYQLVLKLDGEYKDKVCSAQVDYRQQLLQAEQERYKLVTVDYQKTVADLRIELAAVRAASADPPFYKTVWFGVALGVAGTVLTAGMGVYAASK